MTFATTCLHNGIIIMSFLVNTSRVVTSPSCITTYFSEGGAEVRNTYAFIYVYLLAGAKWGLSAEIKG